MRTGSSDTLDLGRRGRSRQGMLPRKARKLRQHRIDVEGLESRTLLATIPAPAVTQVNGSPVGPVDLTGLGNVTTDGDASAPTVAVDPYDSQKVFAAWVLDGSQLVPPLAFPPTAVAEGAFSNDGGTTWGSPGNGLVSNPILDPLTVNSVPSLPYVQAIDPSVGWDAKGDVYVLTMQSSSAADGALILQEWNFSGSSPVSVNLPNNGIIYQWVTGSDAATSPTLSVDYGTHPSSVTTPPTGIPNDPFVNNVYVAWASIDVNPSIPIGPPFNPNRIELVVGTPVANPAPGEESMAFSGVTTANAGGNFGPQLDSHPTLVINPGNAQNPGQITIGWEDFGSLAGQATVLMSNIVLPGDTAGFTGNIGFINPGTSITSSSTQGDWSAATVYEAGPSPTVAEDPTSPVIGDINGDGIPDIVVADSSSNSPNNSGLGILPNQGAGIFPTAGITAANIFRAGPNPTSVALGDFIAGHSSSAILDAALANDNTPSGGVSVLPNGTTPTDGKGVFGTPTSLNNTPAQQGTSAVVSGFFDGSSQLSLVAVNSASNSISIFPDASTTNASFISTPFSPVAVAAGTFAGGNLPGLAVLYSNGTVQFFTNVSPGPGNIKFTPGQILGNGIVAIYAANLYGSGLPDLAAATSSGEIETFQNVSTPGGATIQFNQAPTIQGSVIGTPVALTAGVLSSKGNYVDFEDLAVVYKAPAASLTPNESFVAVFQNPDVAGSANLIRTTVPGLGTDWDAKGTFPTGITVGALSGGTWYDIVVTNSGGRGTISVLQPTALPTSTLVTPGISNFPVQVSIANPNAIDNLTVTVALTDNQTVSNLKLVLIAPGGTSSIVLVENQIDSTGKASPGQGLPSGNAIGVFGFSPSGSAGTPVDTIFDDNATRSIYDSTPAPTNGNTAVDYIGYFRPERGSLQNFLDNLNGNINGQWILQISNFSAATPVGGNLERFSLQFSSGMTEPVNPTVITDEFDYFYGANQAPMITDVEIGSLTDTYPTAAPSTPQGIGPGLVFAEDNTLGPFSPFQGRIYAAFVGYFDVITPTTNPRTNTDIFLVSSDDGGQTWSSPILVNDDQGITDGLSGANDSNTNPNADITGRSQYMPEIAVDQSTGTLVLSWRDARDDAANARVATYLTTSIDGGQTFGPQSYANPTKTAVDAITGATNVIGPASDDQAAPNAQTDARYGYGNQMGLAVADGQVFPIWAGNFFGPTGDPNDSFFNTTTGAVNAYPLNIWYQPMTIAAGPRIISSTMGPVVDGNLAGSAIDLPQFVPPAGTPSGTPTISAIPVTGDPSLNITSLEVTLSMIYPRDGNLTIKLIGPDGTTVILYQKAGDTGQSFSNTTFSESATQSLGSASAPYTGTFLPVQSLNVFNGKRAVGNWSLEVDGGIGPNGGILQSWSISINGAASKPSAFEVTFDRAVDPQALINMGQATFTKSDIEVFYHDTKGGAPIPLLVTSVAPMPPPYYVTDPTQDGTDGFRTFIINFDPTKLPSGASSGITDFTGTYSYVVVPDGGGTTPTVISSPIWSFATVPQAQPVISPATDPDALNSTPMPVASFGPGGSGTTFDETLSDINLTGFNNQTISGLTVNVNIADPTNGLGDIGDLFIGLITPNGVGIVLYEKPGDPNKNLTNVTFSDRASQSIEIASGPYTNGTFESFNPLTLANGGPVNGTYTLFIDNFSSINIGTLLNWSITVNSTTPGPQFESGAGMDQNADGTSDENILTTPFIGLTPGDAYMAPNPQTTAPFTFNATNFFNPPFNLNSLPIIMPGPYVVSTSVPNGTGSDNLVMNGSVSSLNVTFDRPIQTASVTPGQVLQIMGPIGPITGPQNYTSDGTLQVIPAAVGNTNGVLNSTTTVPSFGGTFTITHVTVRMNLAFSDDADLSAVLIAPDGTQVPLFSGVGGTGSNFINTTFDDSAETSITDPGAAAPFTGSYRPSGQLSTLDGHTVDIKNAAGLWVPGVWTLQITNTKTGTTGTLENWSLSLTSAISVTPVNPVNGLATTFMIGFPQQQLSGTYTIQMGADPVTGKFPVDANGDAVDSSLDAGLAVLRGGSPSSPVKTVNYASGDLPKIIPAPGTGQTTAQVTSTIIVPDNFLVQGDTTSSGISGLRVTLSLTYPSDPDLILTLNHYDLNGDLLASVVLATNVGGTKQAANFSNTTFDDNATTPIENAGAPFFGTFNPQIPLSDFAGLNAQGTWVLVVQNGTTAGSTGTLNSWSLSFQRPTPTSGLGDPNSDDINTSFRIFDLAAGGATSGQAWTPVGSSSIGAGAGVGTASTTATSGSVSSLAVDPSDPTGNTVYAAGATGGVWKTTDFLTTAPGGPTWISLTDFGPSEAVNIGSITLFPRNHNTSQTVIIAATGEGDTSPATPGVGFLISMDGGTTWSLDDSSVNVDSSGNPLPIETNDPTLMRNRTFVGDTAYQVVVDPRPNTSNGDIIIYAALSGPTGGVWRSLDSGAHWSNVLAGQATSVILDQDSGATTNSGSVTTSQGNLQVVYAGIAGVGVEMSPNQGGIWSVMTGGQGNPLIVNTFNNVNVSPVPSATPNGAEGEIVLASPAETGNAAQDPIYEGWLYAAVETPGEGFFGLFETKDFGHNWTKIRIPTQPQTNPSNDVTLPDYSITGSGMFNPQGNNPLVITIDPSNPNIIYLGGSSVYLNGAPVPQNTALARIDTTNIWDAHSLVAYSSFSADGGTIDLNSTGPATINTFVDAPPTFDNTVEGGPDPTYYENFIRNPQEPFLANATLDVFDYSTFTNNGAGVTWVPFDPGGTDYHTLTTFVDPLTGLTRLLLGNDQGVWTILDNNGTFETQVGASSTGVQLGSSVNPLANVDRNGNLSITQFYYGATQPSSAAAEIAGALFYGSSQDNGGPVSDPNILTDGNITWFGPTGDATGVATDQQGLGTAYQFFWPSNGGNDTDFFQFIGQGLSGAGLAPAGQAGGGYVSRTFGLLQQAGALPTPDPQWPFGGGANFAVNPVDSAEVVISSNVGRIFDTQNNGVTWFDIGDPGVFGNPGNFSVALAYGAPDPNAPVGVGDLGNFIYVGTQTGQIYVTENGGGSGTSNNWINISAGLDGKAVEQIVTDPIRGSHDAYAVTTDGVFYMSNSLGNVPWVNITGTGAGSIYNLAYSIFGQSYNPTADGNSVKLTQAVTLSSIVADWRYQIPIDPTNPLKGTHPVLYVSSGGSGATGSGVYQSLDNGQTWTLFPNAAYGAVANGGDLPNAPVTDLDVALGNVNITTGMPLLAGPLQATVFSGTLSSGSATVTNVNPILGLLPGDTLSGNGIPSGTTILSINTTNLSVTLSAPAQAAGVTTLSAANPTATPDPDLLLATTWGRGEFAINLPPLIVGNTVNISPTAPGTNPGDPPFVGTPITISGSSEVSAFGNTTWITVEDVTDPAHPVVIAGYNPANPVPVPNASNSTGANGTFSFNWDPSKYFTTDGVKTIEVFATDGTGAIGNRVTRSFNWDPATQLAFAASGEPPATAEPGQNFASPVPVVVDAEDEFGNIATTYNGPVTISLANGATGLAGGTVTVDAVAGVATFPTLSIGTDGTYKLLGSSTGLATTNPPSTPIVIVGAAANLFIIQQPPSPVQAGAPFSFEVGADDTFGNPTTIFPANATMTVAIGSNPGGSNPSGVAETVPVFNGMADFTGLTLNKVGTGYTLKVSSGSLTPVTTNPIDVTNAPADHLTITTTGEPPATVVAGQTFGMVVTALDPFGNVDIGFSGQVTLGITGGVLTGNTTINVANGLATFAGLAIDTTGKFQIQATSTPTLTSATSTSVTVTPAAASKLVWASEPPPSVIHNYPFGAALDLEDQYGNLETNLTETVSIALDNDPNGANLGGTAFADLLNGVAAFSTLSIDTVGNGYTLQATAGTILSLPSTPIDVTPTPAVSLEITVEPPTSVTVNQTFTVQVTALDQFNNPDGDFNGNVTIGLASGPTLQLGGTLMETASNGIATFSDLSVGTVGGGYTLSVSSPLLVGATSSQFIVNPGAAAKLIVTSEPPSSVNAGSPFGFVITAVDQYGNLATSFNGIDSIGLGGTHPAGSSISGANSAQATNGIATVSGLVLTESGNYTLGVSSTGLTAATTTGVSVKALAASQFVVSTQPPSSVIAGTPFGLTITAEDKYGNQATSYNSTVSVSLSHNPGTGTLGGTQTAQASSGVAQFSGLLLDTAASGYTLAATNGSFSSPPSSAITVTPAPAAKLIVYIPPPTSMISGSQFGLAIAALDQFGNLATGYTGNVKIQLDNNPGNATLSGPTTVAAVNGVANFHAFITTEIAATGYTLEATADNITGNVVTGPITVTPAPATHLVVISEPPSLVTPGASFGFIVAAEDAFGNITTSYTGQFLVSAPSGSGATLGGLTALTPTHGEVTYTGLTLTGTSAGVPLTVSSTGLTSATTNPVSVTTPAQVAFATGTVDVDDAAGSASVELVRTGGYTGPISVHIATSNGTAVAGVNYTAVNQVVNFPAGQNSQLVTITIANVGALASGLTVNLGLSSPGANATLGSQSTATLVIQSQNTPPPAPPLVTLESVHVVKNKKHLVQGIQVGFSGAVNASQAVSTAIYELINSTKGKFVPLKKNMIKVKAAVYSAATGTVTLTLKKPLKLTKPLELVVQGTAPSGLQDSVGRLIDGNHDGQSGGNAVAVIKKAGVTIEAVPAGPMAARRTAARIKK